MHKLIPLKPFSNLVVVTQITSIAVMGVFLLLLLLLLLLLVFSPRAGLGRDQRYGSGTLHPGQVFRGSLPLLSPAF